MKNISNSSNIILFAKKYIWYFTNVVVMLIAILGTSIATNIESHITYLNYQIDRNVLEYDEIDLEHICNIAKCNYIYADKFTLKKTDRLRSVSNKELNLMQLTDNIYLNNYKEIVFYNSTANIYIHKLFKEDIFNIIANILSVFFIFFIVFAVGLFKTYKRERNEAMITNIGNEAILANKSMIMITENVHHELNTPIEVIENKVEKVHRTINGYIVSQTAWANENGLDKRDTVDNRHWNKKMVKLEKDFDFIHTSIEQILFVLGKMKNFKTLRYSNGDKSVYNVIAGAFRIILVSYSEIHFKIDDNFKNYRMAKDSLKNIDLLNVLINHIKNSIEAHASTIKVNLGVTTNDFMKLVITDNGAGIPDKFIKNIFTPNFSSKQIGDSIRGNGMYLNKHIINEFGGNIKILQTSEKGTSIEISFPVRLKPISEQHIDKHIKKDNFEDNFEDTLDFINNIKCTK